MYLRNLFGKFFVGIVLVFNLSACEPVSLATTAGGVVGLSFLEERSADASYQDKRIQLLIHNNLSKQGLDQNGNEVFVMVYESVVMLVGFVPDAADRAKVVELAENTPGVMRLHVYLRPFKAKFSDYSYDRFLGLKLSTNLSLEKGVHAVNYLVRVVDGVVYIMGVALSDAERDQVLTVIGSIKGIRSVVSKITVLAPNVVEPKLDQTVQQPTESIINVETDDEIPLQDRLDAVSEDVDQKTSVDTFGGTITSVSLPALQ